MNDVILHVSDWNYRDKFYQMSRDLLKTFRDKFTADGLDAAWEWMTSNVNYGSVEDVGKPIAYGTVDMTLDSFFFDYNNPEESVEEWADYL